MRRADRNDIGFINEVLNDPDVRPHVFEGSEPLDIEPHFDYFLVWVTEFGVLIAEAVGNGRYIALVAFKRGGWGQHAIVAQRRAMDELFATTDCCVLHATCFATNIRGYRNLKATMSHVRKVGDHIIGETSWEDWALSSRATALRGSAFEKTENHTQRMLGAFCLTAEGGWGGKALYHWNLFHRLCHVPQILPLSEDLPIYAFDGKVLRFDHVS